MPKSDEAKALEQIAKVLGDILTELRAARRERQQRG